MRRIRLSTAPAVLFGAMLLICVIVFLPMRLVLGWAGAGEQGLLARSVTGTIWGSTLREARFGDLAMGDLSARLSPLPLLAGRATMMLTGPGGTGAPPLSGNAFVSRHGYGIGSMTARIATGRAFQPLPVTSLDLDEVTVRFEDDRCVAAEGRVRAALTGDVAGIGVPPSVAGVARCDAGALVLPLSSQAGTESVTLRIGGDGRYRADLSIRPSDPVAATRLEAVGFVRGSDGYALSVEGSL
ncbi:type II secretion system protein N [Sphingomonas sp. Leaf339]|uniref:type II secretion system protein N n=1 Tax=Sphingomonas sp. Leaf339 TaxID=1736343 RepID=UPI0006FA50F4|nr:type II secretion system protein N [Sphingomonas sp. Leaf339]KQU62272.1 type II secretion system protein N [Sphingomonas sp. Leaf339]